MSKKALEILKEKGLKGISYLKLLNINPSPQMYHLIKVAEKLGYIPEDTVTIRENTWLPFTDHGWGNGYVSIPPEHPLYGLDYDEPSLGLEVSGGVTYSQEEDSGWVVGFDTAHGFNRKSHDKNFVKTETMGLLVQIFT
jgi:hypothetical protein